MPRKVNEIVVEWLESKDVGKRHRINVKHIIGKLAEVAVGGEVVVKLNSQCYHAKIVDLLDWTPPERKTSREENETSEIEAGTLSSFIFYIILCIICVSHTCKSQLKCVLY